MLSLILIVPVFFIILVFFGENHYQLPRFHAVKAKESNSGQKDSVYYKVYTHLTAKYFSEKLPLKEINVFHLCNAHESQYFFNINANLVSVQEVYKNEPRLSLISLTDIQNDNHLQKISNKFNAREEMWQFIPVDNSFQYLKEEVFKIKGDMCKKLVLVDKNGHIRGYYNAVEQEEIDRLITEINVLTHEYEHKIPER